MKWAFGWNCQFQPILKCNLAEMGTEIGMPILANSLTRWPFWTTLDKLIQHVLYSSNNHRASDPPATVKSRESLCSSAKGEGGAPFQWTFLPSSVSNAASIKDSHAYSLKGGYPFGGLWGQIRASYRSYPVQFVFESSLFLDD